MPDGKINSSICLATYNGEKYLRSQLDSVLSEMTEFDELIISDNGSSDGTLDILRSYSDKRIRIILCEKRGPANNFENALKYARGRYVFLSDQDDVWIPGRVVRMLEALKSADLVIGNGIVTDATLMPYQPELAIFSFIKPSDKLVQNIVRNSFTGCCMAFNKKILQACLPFPKGIPMHDWWIGLVAICIGKVLFLADPVTLHRRHDSNASTLSLSSRTPVFGRVLMRVALTARLFSRLLFLYWRSSAGKIGMNRPRF